MAEPRIWRNKVAETGTKYHRARLVDRNGTLLDQTSFTGLITVKVFDLDGDDPETAVFSGTTNVSAWVFNTLQDWEDDAEGYNFEGSVTTNQVAMEGGKTYRVCYYFRRVGSSGDFSQLFENKVEWQLGA